LPIVLSAGRSEPSLSVTSVSGWPCRFIAFAQKFQRCLAIAALGNKGFEDFAFMVDGTPKVVDLAVDANKHFIQMPTPLRPGT
jgi:hypothetical protein